MKDKPNFEVHCNRYRTGQSKGADIWGSDWPIPVAEQLDWGLYETDDKQYLATQLTDKILWFIPFRYDRYFYEVPKGHFDFDNMSHKDVVGQIALLEKWNWHTDYLTYDDSYANACIYCNGSHLWDYKVSDNTFSFIRTK